MPVGTVSGEHVLKSLISSVSANTQQAHGEDAPENRAEMVITEKFVIHE